jgi:hypothetical protein
MWEKARRLEERNKHLEKSGKGKKRSREEFVKI